MSKTNVEKIFNSMEGIWEINRTFNLSNQSTENPQGKGLGIFKRTDQLTDTLIYFEKINLLLPNGKISECQQSYFYRFKDGLISKYQLNKKVDIVSEFLHKHTKMFDLEFYSINDRYNANAKGVFQCNQDSYFANFQFNNPFTFSIHYSVTGPCKSYKTYTEYNKLMNKKSVEFKNSVS